MSALTYVKKYVRIFIQSQFHDLKELLYVGIPDAVQRFVHYETFERDAGGALEKASAVPDIYVHSLDVGGDYAGYTLPGKKILKTLFRKGKDKLECKGRPFPSNDLKTEVSQICPEGILCRRGTPYEKFLWI